MSEVLQEPRQKALEMNLECVIPLPCEVFIDLDDEKDRPHFEETLSILREYMGVVVEKETTSKGGGKHIYLTLEKPVTDLERLLLQACLGSDRKRELLSWLTIKHHPEWFNSVLFEVKGTPQVKKVDEDEEEIF